VPLFWAASDWRSNDGMEDAMTAEEKQIHLSVIRPRTRNFSATTVSCASTVSHSSLPVHIAMQSSQLPEARDPDREKAEGARGPTRSPDQTVRAPLSDRHRAGAFSRPEDFRIAGLEIARVCGGCRDGSKPSTAEIRVPTRFEPFVQGSSPTPTGNGRVN